jgi:hypothetical protein
MSTRLQRHIHHRPTRILTPLGAIHQSRPLCMQPTQLRMKPLADDLAIPSDHRPHKRIRTHSPPPVLRKLQSPQQMTSIRVS